ncbi:MAG: UDP-N-acetylmuramoyl-L-alanine--D-glutamate ligase [Myxococcota bacterium]|jgi:UDP-N-acetylmuramoylalanine--D-glutamate ligase|nr:UDP-N-acetylmuramoyl-L-alanine--D-glutamate ligase [Deltaproteobacteria bacterium]MCP4242511.1 UDP-N-acetylmuramoyl-L-alanine--D-glutamate ligase [bacterium]MDP6074811.1 UDP-N-acetylmuramoyl-L-alanine--D-glutamate ligase [Myxococcota bacterium]MDP6244105.1 UDP-N-acetylmuramoyl-L-alanine--D-glutamate ligase [Myxococcota bacterium]MDP7075745.1 UDP-N-acetylmuramoyl-L-alanine--D-glutamate ligase [Myxococcota bacterium]
MQMLADKRVLVLGLGISGRSAARFCADRGARVVAADEGLPDVTTPTPGVEFVLGRDFPDAADFDLVVPSPGVPPECYRQNARRVWGDIELAWRALQIPIVAVTGTNGKSTVTRMIEAALFASGFRARAAGNVGKPALDLVGDALDVAILEVSSFQLETTESFRPAVAVVLNVTPDHLDRHGSFEAYREAKARILANQGAGDTALIASDDREARGLARRARGRVVPFSATGPAPGGAWLDGEEAVLDTEAGAPIRIPLETHLPGRHNRENALAALAAAHAAGAAPERAAAGIAAFAGLPHRMEAVGCVAGVSYVNDSKATNPSAALRALDAVETPIIWIAGGRGKGLDFSALAHTARERVRAAVLVGEATEALKNALGESLSTYAAATLEEAVRHAASLAQPGDVVLLAPACASQDQFRDYQERGECFRTAVHALGGTVQ